MFWTQLGRRGEELGTEVIQAGLAQGSLKEHWGKCRVLGWQVKNGDLGSQQSLFYSRQRASKKNGRNPEDSKMLLMSSKVSSEPGRESDVGDSERRRQADSRLEICAGANKDHALKQRFGGRFPIPKMGASESKARLHWRIYFSGELELAL